MKIDSTDSFKADAKFNSYQLVARPIKNDNESLDF